MGVDLVELARPRPRTVDDPKVDPVTAEVVRGAMETVCFEMATYVSRTATTPISVCPRQKAARRSPEMRCCQTGCFMRCVPSEYTARGSCRFIGLSCAWSGPRTSGLNSGQRTPDLAGPLGLPGASDMSRPRQELRGRLCSAPGHATLERRTDPAAGARMTPRESPVPDVSEGDSNLSPARSLYRREALSAQAQDVLARDDRAYLHQSLSTPCLDALVAKRAVSEARVRPGKLILVRIVSMLCALVDRFDMAGQLRDDAAESLAPALAAAPHRLRLRPLFRRFFLHPASSR